MKQNQHANDCGNSSDRAVGSKEQKNVRDLDKSKDCCNSSGNPANKDCDCGGKGCDCGSDRNENKTSDKSASHEKPKRYKCKNCGTIHDCGTPPKNCCKCDCTDFKEI